STSQLLQLGKILKKPAWYLHLLISAETSESREVREFLKHQIDFADYIIKHLENNSSGVVPFDAVIASFTEWFERTRKSETAEFIIAFRSLSRKQQWAMVRALMDELEHSSLT